MRRASFSEKLKLAVGGLLTATSVFASDGVADSALATALRNRFGWRIAEADSPSVPAERRARQRAYLAANCEVWKKCLVTRDGGGDCRMELELSPSPVKAGTIAEFTLDFPLIEELAGMELSRRSCRVEGADGTEIAANFDILSPDRVKLRWRCTGGDSYTVVLRRAPADASAEPMPLKRFLGGGDDLMLDRVVKATLPSDTWSSHFDDLLGDGRPQLLLGRWTDFAHIYRNLSSKPGEYRFREDYRYLARDPFDRAIETTDYHGRAFSIIQSGDGDGDGKVDLFMSRYINELPLFARNISRRKGGLDFDEPRRLSALEPGRRYVFADFDGDGVIDAIGGRYHPLHLCFHKGIPVKPGETPRFDAPRKLALEIPPVSHLPEGKYALQNTSLAFSAGDVNRDGKPDLTILYPFGRVYVALNRGGGEFSPIKLLRHTSGKEVYGGDYFPNIDWFDLNADGVPDLIFNVGFRAHLGKPDGDIVAVEEKERRPRCVEKQAYLTDQTKVLRGFAIADLDGDGKIRLYQIDDQMRLLRWEFRDGKLIRLAPFQLKAGQRYGCPDPLEKDWLYNQLLCFDFDGDGKKDLLVNSEHNWRFGYYSYFRNLGNGKFEPEVRLHPKVDSSHLKLADSPKGKALEVDHRSNLDYLSVDRRKLISPRQSGIDFIFAPRGTPKLARTLLGCAFFQLNRIDKSPLFHKKLRDCYKTAPTLEKLHDTFNPDLALVWLPDGRIRCQIGGAVAVSKDAIPQEEGKYRRFAIAWKPGRTTVSVDGTEVISMNVSPKKLADRLHLGSNPWHSIQRDRENGDRWYLNPIDFSAPAEGLFEEFGFTDNLGVRKVIDFEKNFGELRYRSHIVYRCTPGVMKQDGKWQLVANFDDFRREWHRDRRNSMYRIPFAQGKVPRFQKAIPIKLAGGKPFISTFRSQYLPVDWDGDGKTELLIASSGFIKNPHTKLSLYRANERGEYFKVDDPEIARINSNFAIHHDSKVAMADLTGGGEPDIVVGSDPGIRIFSRSYLRQRDPKCRVRAVKLPTVKR